jgi:hypothetical protein
MQRDGTWFEVTLDATLNEWIWRIPVGRPSGLSECLPLTNYTLSPEEESEPEKVAFWELMVLQRGFYWFLCHQAQMSVGDGNVEGEDTED